MTLRILALSLAGSALAWAGLIDTPVAGGVETFNSRTGCGYCFTTGPVVLPSGVTFTAGAASTNSGQGAVLGTGVYGLGGNGNWSTPYYAGIDSYFGWMTFELPSLVSSVSAFMNYLPGDSGATILALSAGSTVLEQYSLDLTLPISTPSATDAGAWRGIQRSSADIKAFQILGNYAVVDTLTFGPAVPDAPEPSTTALLAGAMLLLARVGRRRAA